MTSDAGADSVPGARYVVVCTAEPEVVYGDWIGIAGMDLASGYVYVCEASSKPVLEAVARDDWRESTAGYVVSYHDYLGNKPAEKNETAGVVGLKSMQENEYGGLGMGLAENVTVGAAAARVIGGLKHQHFMSSGIRVLNEQSQRQSELSIIRVISKRNKEQFKSPETRIIV